MRARVGSTRVALGVEVGVVAGVLGRSRPCAVVWHVRTSHTMMNGRMITRMVCCFAAMNRVLMRGGRRDPSLESFSILFESCLQCVVMVVRALTET